MSAIVCSTDHQHEPAYFWKSGFEAWKRILTLSSGATTVLAYTKTECLKITPETSNYSPHNPRLLQQLPTEERIAGFACLFWQRHLNPFADRTGYVGILFIRRDGGLWRRQRHFGSRNSSGLCDQHLPAMSGKPKTDVKVLKGKEGEMLGYL